MFHKIYRFILTVSGSFPLKTFTVGIVTTNGTDIKSDLRPIPSGYNDSNVKTFTAVTILIVRRMSRV